MDAEWLAFWDTEQSGVGVVNRLKTKKGSRDDTSVTLLHAPALVGHYSGHGLRVGLIHEARRQGVEYSTVMATTRHKGVTMLRQYPGAQA
jgi:hypothetical protein